jgi:hypothetical protein
MKNSPDNWAVFHFLQQTWLIVNMNNE